MKIRELRIGKIVSGKSHLENPRLMKNSFGTEIIYRFKFKTFFDFGACLKVFYNIHHWFLHLDEFLKMEDVEIDQKNHQENPLHISPFIWKKRVNFCKKK